MKKLIVIESGVDGSGKATQTAMLFEKLKKIGLKVRKVSFPNYGHKACGAVEMYLNGDFGKDAEDVNPYTSSTFYAIDRYSSYMSDWRKEYENSIILCDRYTTSNLIHQGAKLNTKEDIDEYCQWIVDLEYNKNKIPKPDLVIFLDMPLDYSISLMENRKNKITGNEKKDIHESNKEYLEKSYSNSSYICEKYNWKKISCVKNGRLKSIEEISEEVFEKVKEIL